MTELQAATAIYCAMIAAIFLPLLLVFRRRRAQHRRVHPRGCLSCGSGGLVVDGELQRCAACGYEGQRDRGGPIDREDLQRITGRPGLKLLAATLLLTGTAAAELGDEVGWATWCTPVVVLSFAIYWIVRKRVLRADPRAFDDHPSGLKLF